MFFKVIIELNKFGILLFWNSMQHVGMFLCSAKSAKNKDDTVKLADKERFDKEQIVVKETFPCRIANLLK